MKTDISLSLPIFASVVLLIFLLPVFSIAQHEAYADINEKGAGVSADPGIVTDQTADGAATVPDKKSEGTEDAAVVLNMHFRGAADKQPESDPGTDSALESEDIADPLEPLNRVFFQFNDKFYFWALKPVSTVYGHVIPAWGRTRVSNFFENIKSPVRLVSSLLQLKMQTFGAEFARFVLNSTVGMAGLFDIASRHPELMPAEEDLGQTLGFYGAGEGFYLVLPLLGPSSLRDSVGLAGEMFLNPVYYITPLQDALAVRSFESVNETSFKIGDYEDIKESAIDPYISVRDIYKQYRRNKVRE